MRCLWKAIRLPLIAALLILEPLVGLLCSLAFVLGVIACVIFLASPASANFPLFKMLVTFGSLGATAILLQGLIALLSDRVGGGHTSDRNSTATHFDEMSTHSRRRYR